jgi:hypothetical protein
VIGPSTFRWEDVPSCALQPGQHLLKLLDRDALLAVFQPEKSGGRQSNLAAKGCVGLRASPSLEKLGYTLIHTFAHPGTLPGTLFRMRNDSC